MLATLNDLDDPLETAPLTGNISSNSRSGPSTQNYLNSAIQGDDRRAPTNTIDETVWETLSRDLKASSQKMKLVLWPNHLFGGLLQREGGIGGAERGEAGAGGAGLTEGLRGIAGRLQDTDALLQANMSDELRDWDLWYVDSEWALAKLKISRGPLVFSLLLSVLLSWSAAESKDQVFTSVFAISWVGTAAVTFQIRLLGGKM